jgi:hypothetical protein
MKRERCEHCGQVIQGKAVELELSIDNGRYYAEGKFPKGHESQGAFVFGEACAEEKVKMYGRQDVTCKETELERRFFQLMRMYRDLADSILTSNVINNSYYDACHYDLEGLRWAFECEFDEDGDIVYLVNDNNAELVEHLEGQVKALRKLIAGAKTISFMFS